MLGFLSENKYKMHKCKKEERKKKNRKQHRHKQFQATVLPLFPEMVDSCRWKKVPGRVTLMPLKALLEMVT